MCAPDPKRYMNTFLVRPDGVFYTSQDADLKPGEHATDYFALDDSHDAQARRATGRPAIYRCRTVRS